MTSIPRSPISAPPSPRSKARRRPWSWRRPTSNAARSWPPAGASARKTSTCAGKPSRSIRRPSTRPCRRSTPSASAWASPTQPPPGHRLDRGAARPRPELLQLSARRLADAAPECRPVRLLPDLLGRDARTSHCEFLQAVPGDNPEFGRRGRGYLVAPGARLEPASNGRRAPYLLDAALLAATAPKPETRLDRILAHLIPNAPAIKQAEAKVLQAKTTWPRPS